MNINSALIGTEIAVIGVSCRFPDACNGFQFWGNLLNSKESVEFLSAEELQKQNINNSVLNDPRFVGTKGAPIKDKDKFDHAFFNYSAKEAVIMDPQVRVMHECVWEALEDAGYDSFKYEDKIGLVAGLSSNYSWLRTVERSEDAKKLGYYHSSTLVDKDFSVSNIAYKLNLKGPCYSVFTTCSTSLVAIHQACRALLTGESAIMIAGGVSLSLDQLQGYLYQEGMILSADGHCRAFDKDSTGTVKGEGAGFVVLKRLKRAIEDNDNIYAVIKGSAINNDGNRKAGFFAPSITGQAEVIARALKIANIAPETVSYIEAHGTGTNIGDPVEISALVEAFKSDKKQFCAVGSVKTNIGHLDAAAGVAGFIKTVLSIKNEKIVASINYKEPNPHINFSNTPFYIVTETISPNKEVFRAGVSSFGIGGTNAHIILENFESVNSLPVVRPELLIVSANSEKAIGDIKEKLSVFISVNNIRYNDLAYTLQLGRRHFSNRDFAVTNLAVKHLLRWSGNSLNASHTVLFVSEIEISESEEILKLVQHNYSMLTIYEYVCTLIEKEYNCSLAHLSKTLPLNKAKLIWGVIYQYIIVEFLSKARALPDEIIVSGFGELAMYCINGIMSPLHAIQLVLVNDKYADDSTINSKYEKLKNSSTLQYPFRRKKQTDFTSETDDLNNPQLTKLILVTGNYDEYFVRIKNKILLFAATNATEYYEKLLIYLGAIWKNGKDIDFHYLNKNNSARKISIPTYPFESVKIDLPIVKGQDTFLASTKDTNGFFYQLVWQKESLPNYIFKAQTQATYVILTSNTEVEKKLTNVILSSYAHCYVFDKNNRQNILEFIENESNSTIKIISLAGFEQEVVNYSAKHITKQLDTIFFQTLDLIKDLARQIEKEIEIDFITNKCYDITGIETTNVALSALNAVEKIIPNELQNISCRIIDLNTDYYNNSSQKKLCRLINSSTKQNVFAIRNDSLWTKTLQSLHLTHINKDFDYIKDKGLYLITGGLGGMGYTIAIRLLEQTSASVILIGRTKETDIRIGKTTEFDSVKKFGDRAHYYSVDISDLNSLSDFYELIKSEHKNVDGIFHTAGIADFGGIVQRRTNESINEVLSPKIYGALNLFQLFDSPSLSFLTLFSSVGNILYNDKVGQIAYNVANEFLDAFCNISSKVISINWCDWKERGMTVNSIKREMSDKLSNEIIGQLEALSDDEGIEVLNIILNNSNKNVIVFKGDLYSKVQQRNSPLKNQNKNDEKTFFTIDFVRLRMQEFFTSNFSMPFDYESDFFELGADSLKILNVLPQINNLFNTTLTINDFYSYPSINTLANAIIENRKRGLFKNIEQIAVKLGSGEKIVFAFPPAIGIGFLAYNQMAELMPDCTIYAINFLADPDRINRYVSFISNLTQGKSCIFLGYSAGGTLAYEVAKAISNTNISDLIILDTYIYRLRFSQDKNERKLLRKFFEESRMSYGEDISSIIAPLMARFYFYINNLVSEGDIKARIHLIKAEDRDVEELINKTYVENARAIEKYKPWKNLTLGIYKEYNGYGAHKDMLSKTNYKLNIDIISKILNA